MKNILSVCFVLSLVSCMNPMTDSIENSSLFAKASGHELYHLPEFDSLDTYEKISLWIYKHVEYDSSEDTSTWSNPADFLASGKGTCADYSILFMNIAYYGMHIKMDLNIVKYSEGRAIDAGGKPDHAIVSYQGQFIEPQTGLVYEKHISRYSFTFDEVF